MAEIIIYIAGLNAWYSSLDDGATWDAIVGATTPPGGTNFVKNGFTILPDGTWLVVQPGGTPSQSNVYTSTDRGQTWTAAASNPQSFGTGRQWCWLDQGVQLILCDPDKIITSTNNFATITTTTLAQPLGPGDAKIGQVIRTPGGRFCSLWANFGAFAAYSDNGTAWTFTANAFTDSNIQAPLKYQPGANVVIGATQSVTITGILGQDGDGSTAYSTIVSGGTSIQNGLVAQNITNAPMLTVGLALFSSAVQMWASTTSDGTAWSAATLTDLSFPSGVSYIGLYQTPGGAWILFASDGGGLMSMYRSTDGTTWSVVGPAGDVRGVMAQTP